MEDNEQQFTQLVRETKGTIFTVCYMFSKDEDEVNDLFQDTLVNLWRGFDSFEGRSSAKTWVYRVALSTCISADRKKKRRGKAVPLQMNANLFDDNDSDTKQVKMLRQRISKLGPFDRAIVLLWLENMSYEEIGQIVVILPACILFLFYIASELHISYAPMVFFAFFAVIDIALDYRINILNGKAFMQDNIKDMVSKLIVMKKHRFMQFIAGFLIGTIFILWLFYEFYKRQVANGEDFHVGLMFGTAGFILGIILAIFVYCKMQHTNDTIIKQMQELNNE